jgi:two-component system sensor histidine kinase and response regulator WspE
MSDAASFSMMDLFREEVRTHAASLNAGLLELEGDPDNSQRVEPLMRAAHSIKGAARIVGIEPAVRLAHALEDAMVAAQHGRIRPGAPDIDLCLRAADVLAGLAEVTEAGVASWAANMEATIADIVPRLHVLAEGKTASAPSAPPAATQPRSALEPTTTSGTVVPTLETTDNNSPAPPASATAGTPMAPPQKEPVAVMPVVSSVATGEAPEAVVRVTAQSLTRLMGLAGESLVQARWLQPFATSLMKLRKHQDHLAELLDEIAHALSGDGSNHEGAVGEARRQAVRCRQILTERIGAFEDHAAQAEDLNSRLYREVIVSRMRPFADGTHGFPRMVRDLARQLDKQVRLDILGGSTEVDRDILDKLEAPLTHLLRNAVDHAMELPDVRRAAGKPETGVIQLEARHRAGMLVLMVHDDGGGIDIERLRHKIVERGLTKPEMASSLREAELLEFLFLPGFSTAKRVTEVSGRGVGLDVVQDTVRKIGGSVRVSTRLGQGTTFVLQLPITLSVLRAVLVEIGGEPYAFSHNRIDRLIRVPRSQLRSLEHRQFVTVDGQNVGLVQAAQLFDLGAEPQTAEEFPVLLFSDTAGQYGLVVDAFRGEQDLVVRPLDPRLGKVPNISAAALLEDGSPVLIADVEDLFRSMDQLIQTGSLQRCERTCLAAPRKRVLVVDDSITVREVERQLLRAHGYEVAVAVDGQDGWNALRAESFDLIVTDVDMPRMNGFDLLRCIRGDHTLAALPVMIVSYKDREEDRLRGLELGANYYLTKSSFHDDTFLRAVEDLIGTAV